jgi:hypothetical protein
MLPKISERLRNYAHGWLVLALLGGFLLFSALIWGHPGLRAAWGETGPLDAQPFYTPENAYAMVASYGEAGRAAYRTFALTGDVLYPIVYTLLFSLGITWFFQRGFPADDRRQKWNLVPLGAGLFDLLENLSIAAMLSRYPAALAPLAWMGAVSTSLKWLFIALSAVLALTGFFAAWKNRFRK